MSEILSINGTTIDRVATSCTLGRLVAFDKDGVPSLSFSRRGITLAALPDAWAAKPDSYTLGGTLLFSGDTQSYHDYNRKGLGWAREYQSLGLEQRAAYIPVTDEISLTDTIPFNVTSDSPEVVPSREGRTVGQIVADVLEMPTIRTALVAAGLGNYSSAGAGAVPGTVTMSGYTLGSIATGTGGSGYTVAPTVFVCGGGGSGAVVTAAVSAGAVTGYTVVSPGTGYFTTPTIVVSTLPALTISDLNGLGYIPQSQTNILGERVLQALEGVVQASHPNHWLHVQPDGTLRFLDLRGYSPLTLTLGSADRVELPELNRDWSGCYQRVVVRGFTLTQAITFGVKPFPGSGLADGGLTEDFAHDGLTNAQAKTAWSSIDFQQPGQPQGGATGIASLSGQSVSKISADVQGYGYTSAPPVTVSGGGGSGATATSTLTGDKVTGYTVTAPGTGYTSRPNVTVGPPAGAGQYDQGTCTCPSTTTIRVTSSNTGATWPADYWSQTDSGHHGDGIAQSDTLTGFLQFEHFRVLTNTSLAAGGTSDLTIDTPLPSTNYTSYRLFGTASGSANVWRKYTVRAPYGPHIRQYFEHAMAFRQSNGTAAELTSTATATIFHSADGSGNAPFVTVPMGLTVDPATSHIYLNKPAAMVFSTDGRTPVAPDDVQVFLPCQVGQLLAVYPPDIAGIPQYAGTSHTVEGLSRTKYVSVNEWRDYSNQANMNLFAQELHGAICDTVVEGTVVYHGKLDAALVPGIKLNITGDVYTTGYEAINVPIVACELEFNESGDTGTTYTTTMRVSNRRAPYSGAVFTRPSQSGQNPIANFESGMVDISFGRQMENAEATGTALSNTFKQAVDF